LWEEIGEEDPRIAYDGTPDQILGNKHPKPRMSFYKSHICSKEEFVQS
jgi:hypothetical protein